MKIVTPPRDSGVLGQSCTSLAFKDSCVIELSEVTTGTCSPVQERQSHVAYTITCFRQDPYQRCLATNASGCDMTSVTHLTLPSHLQLQLFEVSLRCAGVNVTSRNFALATKIQQPFGTCTTTEMCSYSSNSDSTRVASSARH